MLSVQRWLSQLGEVKPATLASAKARRIVNSDQRPRLPSAASG